MQRKIRGAFLFIVYDIDFNLKNLLVLIQVFINKFRVNSIAILILSDKWNMKAYLSVNTLIQTLFIVITNDVCMYKLFSTIIKWKLIGVFTSRDNLLTLYNSFISTNEVAVQFFLSSVHQNCLCNLQYVFTLCRTKIICRKIVH